MNKPFLKFLGVFAVFAIVLTGFGYNRIPYVGLNAVSAHENGSKLIIEPNLSISLSLPTMGTANEDMMERWTDTMKNLDDNVWVVAHEHTNDGSEGRVLGYVGMHNDGLATVFKMENTSMMDNKMVLMLHYDRGQRRVFEPSTDTTVMVDGQPMSLEVEVSAYPEFFLDDSRIPMNQDMMPETNDMHMLPKDDLTVDDRMTVY